MTQSGPLRRQLTAELRRLREQAALTQQSVAARLDWSPSKVIRIEKGDVRIQQTDLRALLDLYDVTDPDRVEELTAMARESKRLLFTEYRDVVGDETLRYYQLEAGALRIRHFALSFVPGLLQTDEYARAIFAASDVEPGVAERLIEVRQKRRALLERADPPELFVILDENLLHRAVGGADALQRQIEHLTAVAERPNVSIQVLPFEQGAHVSMAGSFIHLQFPDSITAETIYVEHALGAAIFQDDPATTDTYRRRFQELEKMATRSGDLRSALAR